MYLLDKEFQIDRVIEEFWKDMNIMQPDAPKTQLLKDQ
jgi:hypothetical protein